MCSNVMGDDREGVANTYFDGFVKSVEYMHGLERAVQENTVVHVQTCGVVQCAITESHKITDWARLEGTSGGHDFQAPCSSRAT